jgi:hypothetical protein
VVARFIVVKQTKMGNTYQNGYKKQMAIKYTKVASKLSNGHEIHQKFPSRGLPKCTKIRIFENKPSVNPALPRMRFFWRQRSQEFLRTIRKRKTVFLAGKKFEWCRVSFSIMSVGKVSSHFFHEDFVKLKARKRATGGQSYQKLQIFVKQIFVACTVCILVKFYRYFLAGQVFYYHFESVVLKYVPVL